MIKRGRNGWNRTYGHCFDGGFEMRKSRKQGRFKDNDAEQGSRKGAKAQRIALREHSPFIDLPGFRCALAPLREPIFVVPNSHPANSHTNNSNCNRGVAREVLIARSAAAIRWILRVNEFASVRLAVARNSSRM